MSYRVNFLNIFNVAIVMSMFSFINIVIMIYIYMFPITM